MPTGPPTEPNNSGGDEDCVLMNWEGRADGAWNDVPADFYSLLGVIELPNLSSIAQRDVTVNNLPPTATITDAPATALEGQEITLGSRVTDEGTLDTFSYTWTVLKNDAVYDVGLLTPGGASAFTPDNEGLYAVTLQVADDDGGIGSDLVTITVLNVPPVAVDDVGTVDEDGVLLVAAPGVLANDRDVPADTLTAVLDDGPVHGMLTLKLDGSFVYTPDANWNGTDGFTYHASDGLSNSGVASVLITVTPVNDVPIVTVSHTTVTVDEGTDATNSGSFDDVDLDAAVVLSASVGTVTKAGVGRGTWTWSLATADGPTAARSVVITADDGQGGVASVSFTVTVENVVPLVALGDDATIDEGGTFSRLGSFNDPGADTWTATVRLRRWHRTTNTAFARR